MRRLSQAMIITALFWVSWAASAAAAESLDRPAAAAEKPAGPADEDADLIRQLREYILDLKRSGPPEPGCMYG